MAPLDLADVAEHGRLRCLRDSSMDSKKCL
jgi:hypothetical protein